MGSQKYDKSGIPTTTPSTWISAQASYICNRLMLMKYILFSLLSLWLITGCAMKKENDTNPGNDKQEFVVPLAKLGYSDTKPEDMLPVSIVALRIKGSIMEVDIEYTGGCETSNFQLEGSDVISKSMPPIRNIRLVRTGPVDACKKLVMETLQFDIRPLAYTAEKGSQIYLLADKHPKILYTFE